MTSDNTNQAVKLGETSPCAKISEKAAQEAALADGLLNEKVAALPVKRWPGWARVRYADPVPRSRGDEAVDPLTVDE